MYFLLMCGPFLTIPNLAMFGISDFFSSTMTLQKEKKKNKLEQSMEQNFKRCDFEIM